MRNSFHTTLIAALILLSTLFAGAQPPEGKATPGTTYGEKITADNAVPASELPALLKGNDTVQVKVRAKVNNVCSNKGCWLTFVVDDATEGFVKMKDYGFFVPLDLQGKTVVLEGKSFIKTTTAEELKHYAEDAKKSQKEIDAIKSDQKEIRLIASGILVAG